MPSEWGSRLPTRRVAVPGRAQSSGRPIATSVFAVAFVSAVSDDAEILSCC